MPLRHEWKIEISAADRLVLRSRLMAVAQPDAHGADGGYRVRSLYFDNASDRALREKLDGVDRREKFRLRLYNGDTACLHLEKKTKANGLCGKQAVPLTPALARAILAGDSAVMLASGLPLVQELACKMKTQGLRPRTVVDYRREAFVYEPGHVRVTIDSDLRTGLRATDLLSGACVTVPAAAPLLLEVKWDAFLPGVIRDAIQLPGRRAAAFSKYAQCRMYG